MKLLLVLTTAATLAAAAPQVIDIGQHLHLTLPGVGKWLVGKDLSKVRLFLDSQELHGLAPRGADLHNDKLVFKLDMSTVAEPAAMTAAQRAGWVYAFSAARRGSQTTAGIGLEGGQERFGSTTAIELHMPNKLIGWTTAFFLVLLAATVYLGKRSDLLRESMREELPAKQRWCFSLGRCQMAVWFVLVVGAYLYLYAATNTAPVITASILALIGISAATGLSGVVVDSSKRVEDREKRRQMFAERAGLTARIGELRQILAPPAPPAIPAGGGSAAAPALAPPVNAAELARELQEKEARLAQLRGELEVLPPPPPLPVSSGNFLHDILRENGSVSFHRFQMAVWTVVLGIIFVRSVFRDYMMPEFDATLLGLMGISSGTYLGFKIPDKPKAAPPS